MTTATVGTETDRPTDAKQKLTPVKPTNRHLVDQVEVVRRELGRGSGDLTDSRVAEQIGFSASYFSQWKNNQFRGDVVAFERKIENWLDLQRARLRMPKAKYGLVNFALFAQTKAFLNRIHVTRDFGVLAGPAGIGKTKAAVSYHRENDLTYYIYVTRDNRSSAGLTRLLLRQLGVRRKRGDATDAEVVRESLESIDALVIIDNAHQLSQSGIEFVFGLHDTTERAFALIGNESILYDIEGHSAEQVIRNEQFASRVGMRPVYAPPYDSRGRLCGTDGAGEATRWFAEREVREFLGLYPVKYGGEFFKLCRRCAEGPGHLRALHKRLVHAMEFMKHMPDVDAWHEAEALLYKMRAANGAQPEEE